MRSRSREAKARILLTAPLWDSVHLPPVGSGRERRLPLRAAAGEARERAAGHRSDLGRPDRFGRETVHRAPMLDVFAQAPREHAPCCTSRTRAWGAVRAS